MNKQTKQLILSMIPKWIAVAIILVLVVYNFAGGQQPPVPVDYLLNSEYELKPNPPEIVPYQIVPLDPIPDCRLEMGIEIVYPQSIVNLPEPQKEEVDTMIVDLIMEHFNIQSFSGMKENLTGEEFEEILEVAKDMYYMDMLKSMKHNMPKS